MSPQKSKQNSIIHNNIIIIFYSIHLFSKVSQKYFTQYTLQYHTTVENKSIGIGIGMTSTINLLEVNVPILPSVPTSSYDDTNNYHTDHTNNSNNNGTDSSSSSSSVSSTSNAESSDDNP